jgi:hypothetical protein
MKIISQRLPLQALLSTLLCFVGCGGGSSDSDGVAFSGLLTQGETASHDASNSLRHAEGENIEEVEICALGECSVTDSQGLWGFVADQSFTGGTVLFAIKGHGIDTQSTVEIPAGASDVDIHFENVAGQVELHHLVVDGVTISESTGHQE